ncbi:MAG TPA: ATP synthase F0 subunit B [Pyrinomonadaceae bacterium]|jgi:F0F1-type ATP synthase, subunit b|nr:ATP synthase F0 subunit B [Pyrinomonadaceae bacterium]
MLIISLPEWVNYPGLELWKFADLAIFITVGIVVLRKPLANALSTRRDAIRSEIAKAEKERAQAAEQLAEAQALLAHADADVEAARKQALAEVTQERQRQAEAAETEIARLKTQAEREIELARKASRRSLEQFLATRSLQLAKQSVISQLRPEDDDRFIRERLDELRRVRG